MNPIFDDDAMVQALDDFGGDAVKAAGAIGCSPATMYAFKRRIAWRAGERPIAPRPIPAAPAAPMPIPTAATVADVRAIRPVAADPQPDDLSTFDIPCTTIPDVPQPHRIWIDREYWGRFCARMDRGAKVLLIGPAGCGKTETPREYAARNRFPFLRVSLENSADLRKKFGSLQVTTRNGASATVFVGAQLLALCEATALPGAVILFDEPNMVDASRLAVINEMLDSRTYYVQESRGGRGRVVHIPERVRIVGACNPPLAQFVGAQRMNAALASRFSAHMEIPPLTEAEVRTLAERLGAPTDSLDTLVRVFSECQSLVTKQALRVQVTIRNLEGIIADLNGGIDLRTAVGESIVNACIATGDNTGREALGALLTTLIGNDGAAEPTAKRGRK